MLSLSHQDVHSQWSLAWGECVREGTAVSPLMTMQGGEMPCAHAPVLLILQEKQSNGEFRAVP